MAQDGQRGRRVPEVRLARLGRCEPLRADDRGFASRGSWAGETSAEIEIVLDLLERSRADKKAGQEADHQRGHVLANWIPIPPELIDQLLVLLLAIRALSPPTSRVAATFSRSLTYSRIGSCSAWTCSYPRSMQSARRPTCSFRTPFFHVQVPLDRLADFLQGLGHS